MMKITIETIAPAEQRYDTCGDWVFDKDLNLRVYVSNLGDWKMEACIAVHELIEALLCKARRISQKEVDEFDRQHGEGLWNSDTVAEPGDDPNSPYRAEHFFATTIERLLATELGISWQEYAEKIDGLP
jgi:hypothetical protein